MIKLSRTFLILINTFLVLSLALPVSSSAEASDSTSLFCSLDLGKLDKEAVVEKLFDDAFEKVNGKTEHIVYKVYKDYLKRKILKECAWGCSEETVTKMTRESLEHFVPHLYAFSKYSHVIMGWVIIVSSIVGVSSGAWTLSKHLPAQMSSAISVLAGVTASMFLQPIAANAIPATFRGLRRLLSMGKPFFRDDIIMKEIDGQVDVVWSKQTDPEAKQVARLMSIISKAESRSKEATDLIYQGTDLGVKRAASNLGLIAVTMHKYYDELKPTEKNDVYTAVHELFTKYLPVEWQSAEKKMQLHDLIIAVAHEHDISIKTRREEEFYSTLIKKWLDIP